MDVRLVGVTKEFGRFPAVREVSLEIRSGELVALLGPSGSGKTTLLRLIAGLEFPTRGSIHFGETDASRTPVQKRRIGFVFQHYALFRHMTVAENIGFGLRIRKPRPPALGIAAKVEELLRLTQLEGLGDRYPTQLSGGQRQRVALARALAIDPSVLLFDEPFGALDAQVRKELRRWLRHLHEETRLTGVFVTHDQEEAIEVADRIVVMRGGGIEQSGSPAELYEAPATPFVCEFLGGINRLPCRIERGEAVVSGLRLPLHLDKDVPDGPGTVRVHPQDLDLIPGASAGLAVTIRTIVELGATVRIEAADADGNLLEAEMRRSEWNALQLTTGDVVIAQPRRAKVFPD